MSAYVKHVWNRWAAPLLFLAMAILVVGVLGNNAWSFVAHQRQHQPVAKAQTEVSLTSYVTTDALCRGLRAQGSRDALAAHDSVLKCP